MASAGIKRDYKTDLVKAAAIFFVIVIHTCSPGFSRPVGSVGWFTALFYGTVTRPAVPLFLMCSGALLLDPSRELKLKKLWLRNIARIVAAMLFWSVMYKIYGLVDAHAFSFRALLDGVLAVLRFDQEFHFYYLHVILIFYILLPVLRVFVKAADGRTVLYALGVWFALGILYPTVKSFYPVSRIGGLPGSQWLLNMTWSAAGYGLLGWYLRRRPLSPAVSSAAALAGFLIAFFGTWLLSRSRGYSELLFLEGMGVPVALMAAGYWCLAGHIAGKLRHVFAAAFLSKASFCVYLTHVFFIHIFTKHGYVIDLIPLALSIPIIAVSNLLLCLILYLILSRIPVVKKWLI